MIKIHLSHSVEDQLPHAEPRISTPQSTQVSEEYGKAVTSIVPRQVGYLGKVTW